VSFLSGIVYKHFHPENVDFDCDPLQDKALSSTNPFDSNQAVATILFYNRLKAWKQHFPGFSVRFRKRYGFLAYPATGGFGGKTLLPYWAIRWLQKKERILAPFARLFAFRALIVLEKNGAML
jgi:hypothetical protein